MGTGREWTAIDMALARDPYLRFSLESSRASRDRQWHAVLYREKGRLVARARAETRDQALLLLVEAYEKRADWDGPSRP